MRIVQQKSNNERTYNPFNIQVWVLNVTRFKLSTYTHEIDRGNQLPIAYSYL